MLAKKLQSEKKIKLRPSALRRHILDMAFNGQSAHVGSALSLVDVLAVLYSDFLSYSTNDPLWSGGDRLVMSNGHGVMAQYACLRELGWVSDDQIKHYLKNGSKLRCLSEQGIPGIDVNGGSLGHGLPIAVGLALGSKLKKDMRRTFCIVGDGELNEGSIWEGVMIAAQQKLNKLILIVDRNGLQAMGKTEDISNTDSIAERLVSFGFKSVSCDGHDPIAIKRSIEELLLEQQKPLALIAKTLKGKGVSFMEDNNTWHYKRLSPEAYAAALAELKD